MSSAKKTSAERRLLILTGIPFLLLLFAGLLISTLSLKHQSIGELSNIVAVLHTFGIVFIFNLVDWLILDRWIF